MNEDENIRAVTARHFIRESGSDMDKVYSVINRQGMDPLKLYPRDIDKINKLLRGSPKALENTLDVTPYVREYESAGMEPIVRIDRKDGTSFYAFASKVNEILNRSDRLEYVPMETFADEIDVDPSKPQKKKSKGKGNPGKGKDKGEEKGKGDDVVKPTGTKGKEHHAQAHTILIEAGLHEYLLSYAEQLELRLAMSRDPKDRTVNLTYSPKILSQFVPDDVRERLERGGLILRLASVDSLMNKAKATKKRRLDARLSHFLDTEEAEFLDEFNPKWVRSEDLGKIVQWLGPHAKGIDGGMPFLINCIRAKFGDHIKEQVGNKDGISCMRNWSTGAQQYEFVQAHPYARKYLDSTEQLSSLDISIDLVRDFAGKPNYKPGDARDIVVGLVLSGKTVEGSFNAQERFSGRVDYLIRDYEKVSVVIERATRRTLKDPKLGSYKFSDRLQALKSGSYKIECSKDAMSLGEALGYALVESERAAFLDRKDNERTLEQDSINEIIGLYIGAKGNKFIEEIKTN